MDIVACLRKGDVLMVTRIDRLARSIGDLQDIVRAVRARGASLIDTSTAATNVSSILGVFAELETNLRKERQLEGIASAKARGVDKGARQALPGEDQAMTAEGKGPSVALPAVLAVARYGKPQWSTRPSSADFHGRLTKSKGG